MGDLNAGKKAEILQTDGAFGVLDEVRGMEDRGSDGIKGLGGYEIRTYTLFTLSPCDNQFHSYQAITKRKAR